MPTKRKRKDEINLRPYFGKVLVRLRGKKSKEALAKSSGMDAKTLDRLEKGDAPLREDYAAGLCRSFEITYPDLLRYVADCYEETEREDGPSVREMSADDLIRRLRKVYGDIARLEVEARDLDLEIKRRQIKETP